MKIQLGRVYMNRLTEKPNIYPNKTKRFLLPVLNAYGSVFMSKFNNAYKVAAGIGDIIIEKTGKTYEKHLFILFDAGKFSNFFYTFLDWVKEQPMYEDDYPYDNVSKSTYHMVVIKLPKEYYDDFDYFKLGQYSKMFAGKEGVEKMFEKCPDSLKVFVKDHNYKIYFVDNVLNKVFHCDVKPDEYDGELELPPNLKGDYFNHYIK